MKTHLIRPATVVTLFVVGSVRNKMGPAKPKVLPPSVPGPSISSSLPHMCKSSMEEGRVLAQPPRTRSSLLAGVDKRSPVITSIHLHRASMYAALYLSLSKVVFTSSERSMLNRPLSSLPKSLFCRQLKSLGHPVGPMFIEGTNSGVQIGVVGLVVVGLVVVGTSGVGAGVVGLVVVGLVAVGTSVVGAGVVGLVVVGLLVFPDLLWLPISALLALETALVALEDARLALEDVLLALAWANLCVPE